MKTKLLLLGLGIAGVYFLDTKKGKKRRATFSKNVRKAVNQAEDYCSDLADRSKPLLKDLSERGLPYLQTLGRQSQKYATEAGQSVVNYTCNGGSHWQPSARVTGATAGALALYSAGRRGLLGAVLRTLSLGFFTRALLASR
jgi:hypothetical protein